MRKPIVVKKPLMHRCCFGIFTSLIAALVIIVLFAHEYLYSFILIPLMLAFGTVTLYLETWQISFSSKSIQHKIFWQIVCEYSYHRLTDAEVRYSYTNHEYVTLIFREKKNLHFRLKDENALKALKIVSSHKSVCYHPYEER